MISRKRKGNLQERQGKCERPENEADAAAETPGRNLQIQPLFARPRSIMIMSIATVLEVGIFSGLLKLDTFLNHVDLSRRGEHKLASILGPPMHLETSMLTKHWHYLHTRLPLHTQAVKNL